MLSKIAAIMFAVFIMNGSFSHAATDPYTHKPQIINFRIVAISQRLARSSFSPNRDALLVELIGKDGSVRSAKIVFRYMGYEYPVPESFLDYGLVHTFKVVRDESCDETWQSFSTKATAGPHGELTFTESVIYSRGADPADLSVDDILPCYVTQMRGYKRSRSVPAAHVEMSRTDAK